MTSALLRLTGAFAVKSWRSTTMTKSVTMPQTASFTVPPSSVCRGLSSTTTATTTASPATTPPPPAVSRRWYKSSSSSGGGAGLFQRLSSFLVGAGLSALVTQYYILEAVRDGNSHMLHKQHEMETRLAALEKKSK